MSPAPGTLEQHRQVLAAAHQALTVFSEALFQAGGDQLGELLREVDALASVAGGVRAEIVLEAKASGEILQAGKNTREWVNEHAPSQRQGGAGQLASLIDTVHARTAGRAGLHRDLSIDPDSPIVMIWQRTRTGEATPATALATRPSTPNDSGQKSVTHQTTPAPTSTGTSPPAATTASSTTLTPHHGAPPEEQHASPWQETAGTRAQAGAAAHPCRGASTLSSR